MIPDALPHRPFRRAARCSAGTRQRARRANGASGRLTHDDYDAWRSIYTPTLTQGRAIPRLFVHAAGRRRRAGRSRSEDRTGAPRGVGALPPPVIQNADEINPDEAPAAAQRADRDEQRQPLRCGHDVCVEGCDRSGAASEEAAGRDAEGRPADRGCSRSPAATRIPMVKSVQMPARGGAWLAYLKEPSPSSRDSNAREPRRRTLEHERRQDRIRHRSRASRSGVRRRTDIRERAQDYAFARDGKTLLYTVSSATAPKRTACMR